MGLAKSGAVFKPAVSGKTDTVAHLTSPIRHRLAALVRGLALPDTAHKWKPTPARTYDEVESTKTMLDRTEQRLGLKPRRLAADTAYGTGRFLGWLVGRRIAPHIPVRDASERDDGTLSRSDFRWDRRRGVYICPNGKVLHTSGRVHEGKTLRYLASKYDCDVCALKMQCCPKGPSRQIPRDVHEYARDVTRRLMRTRAFLKSRDQRKRVEMALPT